MILQRSVITLCIGFSLLSGAQNYAGRSQTAVSQLLSETCANNAILGWYAVDESGKIIAEYQSGYGLTTASTQKIFTAAYALESLGGNFRFNTDVSVSGTVKDGVLHGNLILKGFGDPVLGSSRYPGYGPEAVFSQIKTMLADMGIRQIQGDIICDDSYYDYQVHPGGWPVNDIGNYYGAGVWGLNWRENQFDAFFEKGKLTGVEPSVPGTLWIENLKVGGTRDKSIIWTYPGSDVMLVSGMLPERKIKVSGSIPNPAVWMGEELKKWLETNGIITSGVVTSPFRNPALSEDSYRKIGTLLSPELSEMVKVFLSKSVNLYGEAFLKAVAAKKGTDTDFPSAVAAMKDFWIAKGIPAGEINFADGSGLSPQNYVTARAEVAALRYAYGKPWYQNYIAGFPVQANGMQMKSGTMKDTKSYAGIHQLPNGKKVFFSVIVNNYSCAESGKKLQNFLNTALK